MSTPNHTNQLHGYNYGAVLLHWLIALLIILQLIGGFTMERMPEVLGDMRFSVIQWHKTFGILVLALTLARILWRLMNKPPAHAPMSKLELFGANCVVVLFYALMLAVPLAGWVLVSASPTAIPTLFFKVQSLVWPNLPIEKSKDLAHQAALVHRYLAYSFVGLLVLHIGGALKHVIFDKIPEIDRMTLTDKLPRKDPKRGSTIMAWTLVVGFIAICLGLGQMTFDSATNNSAAHKLIASSPTTPMLKTANWLIDKKASTLDYSMDFSNMAKNGTIPDWKADIAFDPTQLQDAKALITINSASVTYDDAYVQGSLNDQDGLNSANHPQILVALDQFSHIEQNHYTAKAKITIRDVSVVVDVPFQFDEQNDKANVEGSAQFDRLSFGLGKQNDAEGQWLGKTISVHFKLVANKK